MNTVYTTFQLNYSDEQYRKAQLYVEDMKKYPKRVYWTGKENLSDEQLILAQIAHKILSGFYNNYDPAFTSGQIVSMENNQ